MLKYSSDIINTRPVIHRRVQLTEAYRAHISFIYTITVRTPKCADKRGLTVCLTAKTTIDRWRVKCYVYVGYLHRCKSYSPIVVICRNIYPLLGLYTMV